MPRFIIFPLNRVSVFRLVRTSRAEVVGVTRLTPGGGYFLRLPSVPFLPLPTSPKWRAEAEGRKGRGEAGRGACGGSPSREAPASRAQQFMCFSRWMAEDFSSAGCALVSTLHAGLGKSHTKAHRCKNSTDSAPPPLPAGVEIQMLTWLKENTVLASPDAELNAC